MALSAEEIKQQELSLRAEELKVAAEKLRIETRKSIVWSAPLILAVIGGLLGWAANMGVEFYKANASKDAKLLETALDLIKASHVPGDVEKTRANLQFIIHIKLGPDDLRENLDRYLNRPDAPIPSLNGSLSPAIPLAPSLNSPIQNTFGKAPSSEPARKGETGWFYLGREADGNWITSSAVGTFAFVDNGNTGSISVGQKVGSLEGKTLKTLSPKYLRAGGSPGQRVRSPVMRTLAPGTVLQIISVDNAGKDPDDGRTVLWAEVRVVAE